VTKSRVHFGAKVRIAGALALALFGSALASTASAQTIGLSDATIADINRAFDRGTLTSEALVKRYLARIAAYDQAGPRLNAVLAFNAQALETARALDRERKTRGPRSPLHGIPIVVKDNIDTHDMPTTAGSVLLAGSIPPDDAFVIQRLRDAGAVILAKLNLSEFASGGALSSLGGPIRNPHDLARSPSGSSGGTGVAMAAGYAQCGLGTDTGGSVRGPSTANGVVGLKPTHGLVSRDGVIPLALSFDMVGPMARHVYDLAVMLGAMAGVDPADSATRKGEGHALADYTQGLDPNALRGARIGVARDFLGQDEEVDWVIEASLAAMRKAGATIVDLRFPKWFVDVRGAWYVAIRWREFRDQIPGYLATLGPRYPKTLEQLVERSMETVSPTTDGGMPNPPRWSLMQREEKSGSVSDPEYRALHEHAIPLLRSLVDGMMEANRLDAIVYPTNPTRPGLVDVPRQDSGPDPVSIANITGFPDLIVPAGFTSGRLPVGLSFLGPAWSEAKLLALGYAFEQQTKARRAPMLTPPLPGEAIER